MAHLAGISPGRQSSFSNIGTSLSIARSRVVSAVVTLTDLTCHLNPGVHRQLGPCSSRFLGLDHQRLVPDLPFRSFFVGGAPSPSVVDFERSLFSVSTKRHSKDIARVSIFYGGTNLLSDSFPVEA